jgi:hypothetical protein
LICRPALAIFFVVVSLTVVNSIDLHCEYHKNFWTPFGSLKECLVRNLTVSTPHKNIASVGNHFVNNDEVKSFHIYDSPSCLYIPFGIEKFFSNIEVLSVNFCGLKIVTKEDLKPLKHLRGLYLQHNEIEILGNDLFAHNPEIQVTICAESFIEVKPKPRQHFRKSTCAIIS